MNNDHLIPRILAEITSRQEERATQVLSTGKSADFDKHQGFYFGLEEAKQIIEDVIKSSERS